MKKSVATAPAATEACGRRRRRRRRLLPLLLLLLHLFPRPRSSSASASSPSPQNGFLAAAGFFSPRRCPPLASAVAIPSIPSSASYSGSHCMSEDAQMAAAWATAPDANADAVQTGQSPIGAPSPIPVTSVASLFSAHTQPEVVSGMMY